MKTIRKISKPAAILLSIQIFILSGFSQSVTAAMIGTESIIKVDRAENPRDYLNSLLSRKEIQSALISQGIDPKEARYRIDNLTDDEINYIVHELDQLPAGGSFFETFIIIAFLVFLILLITDISGYTDVFPFVKKHASKNTAPDKTTKSVKKIKPSLKDTDIKPDDMLIIYFKPGSNDLTAKAIQSLDRVVEYMEENAKAKVDIIGFSDSNASSSYDVMLSESRANTVKSFLIAKGIAPKKISTLGMGSQGFLPTDGTEKEKQMIGGVTIEFNLLATN
ncbi:MAG: OmpA family protein [Deltaproteobacteria bacterium]|nr:OmpA family protein [Deltaproteobacteria bacterium]